MTESRSLVVVAADAGIRLDRYLADQLPLSRQRVQQLIRTGQVLLNGQPVRPARRVEAGDWITVRLPTADAPAEPVPAADLPLAVLYADQAVVVVDKPAGQVVHPAAGHATDTLVNVLLAHFPDLGVSFRGPRPGIVHRLDRDTSGVMVVARTPPAAERLKRQFRDRTVTKVYLALVKGAVTPPAGIIDAPIGRDAVHRKRMTALAGGRRAQTIYRVLDSGAGYSWLELRPQTGRTHQIRVHVAAIGHPVAGDVVYGRRDRHIGRLALHSWQLAFDHPQSGERMTFTAPLPEDLRAALAALGLGPKLPPEDSQGIEGPC